MDVSHPSTDWCIIAGKASDMQERGKFGSKTSKYVLRNIAGKASDIHEEVSLEVKLPNTDWRNNTGTARVMQGQGKFSGYSKGRFRWVSALSADIGLISGRHWAILLNG